MRVDCQIRRGFGFESCGTRVFGLASPIGGLAAPTRLLTAAGQLPDDDPDPTG